ncbi:MAG: PQQ-dependent sugar dehydrogenase [Solirubrobacteraceae bacterium]
MVTPGAAAALAALAAVGAGCGAAGSGPASAPVPPSAGLAAVPDVAAMAPLPGGGLRVGERRSGRIRDLRAGARPGPAVARVAVSAAGQRGLLGLAVDRRGRTFAAWTAPDAGRRLLVGQVSPGPVQLVWRGPRSATLANGGHLALTADGRLVLGVGDLQDRARVPDPAAPNGKLLSLDPDAGPGQRPGTLSSGWNNPFAFAVLPGGAIWVADNSAGRAPERLARGDRGAVPARTAALPAGTAPSGTAAISAGAIAVCGVRSGLLLRYRVGPGGQAAPAPGPPLARDCRLGVARLAGGRLAYSTGTEIRTVRP